MKKSVLAFLSTILLPVADAVAQTPPQNQTPFKVVGIDHFGRSFETVSGYKDKKQVGIFYWPWIGQPFASGAYDATKIAAMPNGLNLLFDIKSLNDSISPNGQAHFWGEPLFGYYNSADEWVIRKQMKMLTTAGIDFIAFDLTNRLTYRAVYEKVFRIIEEMIAQGANPPRAVFYTHSKSIETTNQLYNDLYKPGLYPGAWYRVNGKPMIIAYTEVADDIAEAKTRSDTTYSPQPYLQEVADFFYFKKPQWPFDPTYQDGFPWVEWSYPQPLHGNIMSVSVASHPKVPMSRSITSGWINWGRGWDPVAQKNKSEDVDRGTFFQHQWDHALKMDPDTVFVGGWNEWIAYKQPYGGEFMLCDAANREYSRDIEPMRGGYEDAFYIQLIKNVRAFKGIADRQDGHKPAKIDISKGPSQWSGVQAVYRNLNPVDSARDHLGATKRLHYKLPRPTNTVEEIKLAHDRQSLFFLINSVDTWKSHTDSGRFTILLSPGSPEPGGWNGYRYLIESDLKSKKAIVYKIHDKFSKTKIGTADIIMEGDALQVKCERRLLGLSPSSNAGKLYFKVADGVHRPGDIMEYYVSGSVLPMGRLSYLYAFTEQ